MGQYLEKGKELLKVLTKNGCEAYIIGEATRSEIMEIDCKEIEIVTSATPSMIKGIFADVKIEDVNENTIKVTAEGTDFLVSTFRSDKSAKVKRRAPKELYSKNLIDELSNREFTIDAIAMTSGGKFSDAYDGFKDIKNKCIRGIGNTKIKFKNNPMALLKLARLYAELGFKVDDKLQSSSRANSKLLSSLEPKQFMPEIKRILEAKYYKKGLKLLHSYNVSKNLPVIGFELMRLLKINKTESIDDLIINSFVKEKKIDERFLDFVENEDFVKKVANLAMATPKSQYDNILLFNYGLDVAIKANEVNSIYGKAFRKSRKITKQYEKLPIKKPCDLEFKGDDLIELANGEKGQIITQIMEDVIMKVLLGELKNDYDLIRVYAAKALQELKVLPKIKNDNYNDQVVLDNSKVDQNIVEIQDEVADDNLNKSQKYDKPDYGNNNYYVSSNEDCNSIVCSQDSYKPNYQDNQTSRVDNSYTDYKLANMERELAEVKRLLNEKDDKITSLEKETLRAKLRRDVDKLVVQNIGMLQEMNCVNKEADKIAYEKDLRKTYEEMLLRSPEYKLLSKEDLNNDED